MTRSVWKGPFYEEYLLKKAEATRKSGKTNTVIKIWTRRSTILPEFVGLTFGVYNGKKFIPVSVNESSINNQDNGELEKLFIESLGMYLEPDVLIYDSIKSDEDLKYISVILNLKENYLENDSDYEILKSEVESLLLSKFSKGTFIGKIKFVYKSERKMATRTLNLDWRKD